MILAICAAIAVVGVASYLYGHERGHASGIEQGYGEGRTIASRLIPQSTTIIADKATVKAGLLEIDHIRTETEGDHTTYCGFYHNVKLDGKPVEFLKSIDLHIAVNDLVTAKMEYYVPYGKLLDKETTAGRTA